MKNNDYNMVLNERIKDVETLLIYFNVTTIREYYKERDGKFYISAYDVDMDFFNAYRNGMIPKTIAARVRFGKIRAATNKANGIPWKLMHSVIGKFKGKDIKRDDIFKAIQGYKLVKHGQKYFKGKGKCIANWNNKWLMMDKTNLRNLLCDDRYDDINSIPSASNRIKKIISKWENGEEPQNIQEPKKKVGRPSGISKKTIINRLLKCNIAPRRIEIDKGAFCFDSNGVVIIKDDNTSLDKKIEKLIEDLASKSLNRKITSILVPNKWFHKVLIYTSESADGSTNIDADVIQAIYDYVKRVWGKQTINMEEKDMTVEELKESFAEEASHAEPTPEIKPPKKEQEESLDDLVRAWNDKTVEVKKEQPKTNEDKRAKYFELKEKYLTGVIDFTEFRNWMVENGVKKDVLKDWDDYELNRLQEQVQVQEKPKSQVEVNIDELVKLVS